MDTSFLPQILQQWLQRMPAMLERYVLSVDTLLQVSAIAIAMVAGRYVGKRIGVRMSKRLEALQWKQMHLVNLSRACVRQMPLILALVILWLAIIGLRDVLRTDFFLTLAANLLAAWVIIRLEASVLLDRFWSNTVATTVWLLAALNILGILGPALDFLDRFGITVGAVHITVTSLLKAAVILAVLFRSAGWVSGMMDRKLQQIPDITPSTHVLLSKAIKISIFAFVIFVALNSVGLDLTALAVFGGAVGVGVGFGLQKVVGNFVSGIILLIDKSIKPGDVIQIGDTYGWIVQLRGRYVSVNTRDGRELLIPNEDLITQQVINWSYSNPNIRLKVPVGISYQNDPHRAMAVMLEAVKGVERVLTGPAPKCLLTGFGDSSVDLELRFWIKDPQNGVNSVRSEVMLKVWDALKEAGIEIPFPQRDVHLRSAVPLESAVAGAGRDRGAER